MEQTKRPLKKLLCILLTAMVMSGMFPQAAQAKIAGGVDPARVGLSKRKARTVIFSFGNLNMYGKLQPGMDEDKLNELIKETLRKMGMTELELQEAHRAWEKAKRWEDSPGEFEQDRKDVERIIGGVPGVGDVIGAANIVREKFNNSDYSSSEAMTDLGVSYVKNKVPGLSQAEAVAGAENLAWRKEQKRRETEAGVKAKQILDKFYDELQKKIDEYKKKNKLDGWEIVFKKTLAERPFTFFGTDGNRQFWTLDMHMKEDTSTTESNYAGDGFGSFSGTYWMVAKHDMKGFVSKPHEAVMNIGSYGESIRWYDNLIEEQKVWAEFRPPQGTAFITRRISGECRAFISDSGQIEFTLEKGEDKETVQFSGIAFNLNWQYFHGLTGTLNYHDIIPAEIKNLGDEGIVYVKFDIGGIKYINYYDASDRSHYMYYEDDYPTDDYDWDTGIWEPWDVGEKKLFFAGR